MQAHRANTPFTMQRMSVVTIIQAVQGRDSPIKPISTDIYEIAG